MGASQAQWLWPRRQGGNKEKRPRAASRLQKSQTTSGSKNLPHAAKSDGGVREPELAGGTPSPRKKARGEEDSSLDRLNREKVFAAVKGRHGVKAGAGAEDNANDAEAKVVIEDDSDDNSTSGGGPRCKTRSAKGGRSAVATTG